ncbi:MAG: hypothetical protein JJLCMIEE_03554 [Acidimicrobiales bacterium]|nr:MAG: HAMP domain-containing protein [Actinomycetota bacterium]MBV6510413.1 hypothetical protein [Acidimicrobiales bacterium]RIK02540.1 MAG: histidine kinase [Acidobacteriota bacterium]
MSRSRRAALSLPRSLRGRLLFLICLATLPAVLFAFFVAENERSAALTRTERDALHLASLVSREHAHQIQGARDLLSWLGTKMTAEGVGSPILEDPGFLPALLAGHPQLANIGVLSPDGEVLASAYPLPSYRSWRDNPAYEAALQTDEVVSGTYLVSPIFERPTLNLAYAVRDAGDEVIAVLFDGLDLAWLSELDLESGLPEGFTLFIADSGGQVLAQADEGGTDVEGASGQRIDGVADLAQSQHGRVLEIGDTGDRRYFVAVPLQGAPELFAVVALPHDQVVEEANSAFYRTLAGLTVLTLFTIAAVFIAAELGFLRGLRSLARAAKRLGSGDLSARARAPRAHDELASVTTAFNEMAESLADRQREAVDAQARLRALASRLDVAREAEAARISRELHDEIGQTLTSLKIDLSQLQACCPSDDLPRPCASALQEGTASMARRLDDAVNFVRRISSDLRPGVLDRLGLIAALQWQAREIEARTGLVVQVEAEVADGALDELVSVTLFRIAQEALNNVVRHAQAKFVEIDLVSKENETVLAVRDDGTGIDTAAIDSMDSLGLIGMRERATLIGGQFSISGAPQQGTIVTVTVPLPLSTEGADAHTAG